MKYFLAMIAFGICSVASAQPVSTLPPLDSILTINGKYYRLQLVEVVSTAAPPLALPSSPGPASYATVQQGASFRGVCTNPNCAMQGNNCPCVASGGQCACSGTMQCSSTSNESQQYRGADPRPIWDRRFDAAPVYYSLPSMGPQPSRPMALPYQPFGGFFRPQQFQTCGPNGCR